LQEEIGLACEEWKLFDIFIVWKQMEEYTKSSTSLLTIGTLIPQLENLALNRNRPSDSYDEYNLWKKIWSVSGQRIAQKVE
jgi:hypothetical protein